MRTLMAGVAAAVAALSLLAMPACCGREETAAGMGWPGTRSHGRKLDNVYIRPDVQFKAYQRVRLPPVDVSFADDWDPNHGKVASRAA